MPVQAMNIDEVIDIMDDIVHDCIDRRDRLGYFASLYRTVTIVVKKRCDSGFFEDNDRMRALDTIFANRYFAAYEAYINGDRPTESWQVSFDCATRREMLILQHLLLGMNAHISLDLGIAAVEVSDGKLTPSLERDFNRLNNILASLIDRVQEEVGKVSPLIRRLDWLAWRMDEEIVSFSINEARDRAWEFARELADLTPEERKIAIHARDKQVARFGSHISRLHWYFLPFVWLINLLESKDAREIVCSLSNEEWDEKANQYVEQMIAQAEAKGIDLSQKQTAGEQVRQTKEVAAITDAQLQANETGN